MANAPVSLICCPPETRPARWPVTEAIRHLRRRYGKPSRLPATDPFEMVLWESCAYLVDDETEVDPAWLEGAGVVGLTSGASAPEWLVDRVLAYLAATGAIEVEEVRLTEEHLRFSNVRV